jgi:hypothetical protein
MARKPSPKTLMPATRRAVRDITGGAPKAKRSIPTDAKPGRIGSGRSPMAQGMFVPPGDGEAENNRRKKRRR